MKESLRNYLLRQGARGLFYPFKRRTLCSRRDTRLSKHPDTIDHTMKLTPSCSTRFLTRLPRAVPPPRPHDIPTQILIRHRPIRPLQVHIANLDIRAGLDGTTLEAGHHVRLGRPCDIRKAQIPDLKLGRAAVALCPGKCRALGDREGGRAQIVGVEVRAGYI
jgi:hypothetical protein